MIFSAKIYWPGSPAQPIAGNPQGLSIGIKAGEQVLTVAQLARLVMGEKKDKSLLCSSLVVEEFLGKEHVEALYANPTVAIWGVAGPTSENLPYNPLADKAAADILGERSPEGLQGPILIVQAELNEALTPRVSDWPPARTFFAVTLNDRYLKRVGRGMFMIELTPMGQHELSEGHQLAQQSGLSAKIKLAELYGCRVHYLRHPITVSGAPHALALLFDTVEQGLAWHVFPKEIEDVLKSYAKASSVATVVSPESMFYVNNKGAVTLEVDTRWEFIDVQGELDITVSQLSADNPPLPGDADERRIPLATYFDEVHTRTASRVVIKSPEKGWRLQFTFGSHHEIIVVPFPDDYEEGDDINDYTEHIQDVYDDWCDSGKNRHGWQEV